MKDQRDKTNDLLINQIKQEKLVKNLKIYSFFIKALYVTSTLSLVGGIYYKDKAMLNAFPLNVGALVLAKKMYKDEDRKRNNLILEEIRHFHKNKTL